MRSAKIADAKVVWFAHQRIHGDIFSSAQSVGTSSKKYFMNVSVADPDRASIAVPGERIFVAANRCWSIKFERIRGDWRKIQREHGEDRHPAFGQTACLSRGLRRRRVSVVVGRNLKRSLSS
jgi:hypothetical protein